MKYIYHITKKETWEKALKKQSYDFCTLKSSGFIHASTKDQYLQVANSKFINEQNLILLKIDTEQVEPEIIYENLEGGTEQYPHIYGALDPKAVVKEYCLELNTNGNSFIELAL